ncbi:hypothetical protein VB735_11120 [Halotia wernerae UHCC 0503]|nr:hypothetical protein [Halotia wernerae UHCC 0503]
MKVLKLAAVIDASGNLHLDVPTELSAGTVDVVIVLNPSIPENSKEKSYDFSDQDLRKQNLSLRPERSVGKQSQNFRRLRRFARNDVIP